MSASIILIGPSQTGKTTLSKLLGEALSLPAIDLDDLRWSYYAQLGYDAAKAQEIARQNGLRALLACWKPYSIYSVECVLRDYPADTVIAFGGWHTIFDDEADFQRAKTALAPFPHVIHVLPSPDENESYAILRGRFQAVASHMSGEEMDNMMAEMREFIHYPVSTQLTTMTIYTAGKSPAESCAEIVQRLKR